MSLFYPLYCRALRRPRRVYSRLFSLHRLFYAFYGASVYTLRPWLAREAAACTGLFRGVV